ncbi:MAG: hypothetical protein V7K92_18710 [Nostoc sp.]|uniref:hypothetical protein n=1 Tax=Nostoc sp. TaxID=1180 RepID=UPI002FF04A8F
MENIAPLPKADDAKYSIRCFLGFPKHLAIAQQSYRKIFNYLNIGKLRFHPFNLNVEPFNLNVEPFNLNVEPLNLNVEPLNLNVEPFNLDVEPFNLNVEPFNLNVEPLNLKRDLFKI